METGTIISLAALGMSSISLGWRIVSWRRSGPVVAVIVTQNFKAIGGEMLYPHVGVEARNTGRAQSPSPAGDLDLLTESVDVAVRDDAGDIG
jgi:hypothetical protein